MGKEPLVIIGFVTAVLEAVQGFALGLPAGVHTAIGIVLVALAAVVGRSQVSPVVAPPAPPAPQA